MAAHSGVDVREILQIIHHMVSAENSAYTVPNHPAQQLTPK